MDDATVVNNLRLLLHEHGEIAEPLFKMESHKLRHLWSVWSELAYCAGLLAPSSDYVREFVEWAVTPPYVRWLKDE